MTILVVHKDFVARKAYRFITNNFVIEYPLITIAEHYREKWQIELFKELIKGNLIVKHHTCLAVRRMPSKPIVDSHHRLPSACQNQGSLQESVLNHRDWNLGQGIRPGEDGPQITGNRATTTHSKSGCQ